jgi:hypothetical protein
MKLFLGVIILACLSSIAAADDLGTIGFGPSLDGTTNPKELALGYEKIWGEIGIYTHCGLLFENETNGYCAVVPGVHIETLSGIFVRAGAGPAYVLHTDNRISSHWNVNVDFALGVYRGSAYAFLEGGHISNAGLVPPNLGDDHGLIGLGWRF